MSEQPEDRATDRPEVTTAPPDAPQPRRRGIPAHLGRARTSTVILAVLFLAIGALYLNVRPDPARTAPAGGGGGVEQPAEPTAPATTEPPTTTAPSEPSEPSEPATTEPTTTAPSESTEDATPAPTSGVPTPPRTTVPPTGTPSS